MAEWIHDLFFADFLPHGALHFVPLAGILAAMARAAPAPRRKGKSTKVPSQSGEPAILDVNRQARLLDSVREAVIVRRKDGMILFWNRGAESLYGWTRDDALGQISHELLNDQLPQLREEIMSRLAEAGAWEGELTRSRRDGSTIIVSSRWSCCPREDGELEIVEIDAEITQKKGNETRLHTLKQELEQRVADRTAELSQSNEQLRHSMDRYRFLADSMPQIVWTSKADGSPEYFNRRWREYRGTFDEKAWDWQQGVHPEDLPAVKQKWSDMLGRNQAFEVECRILSSQGEYRWHLVRALAMCSGTGEISQWVGTCTDVHDQKSSAELLARANQELKDEMARRRAVEEQLLHSQKMEAIGRLAGGVAHDFNNLLTIIIGHARLLLPAIQPGTTLHERLTQILNAADRAAGLTSQLLAFSRRQLVRPKVLNLNMVVENAEKMLHRVLGEDVRLVTALQRGLGNTRIDPVQIDQVLINVIINARDAMPQGGQISIGTSNVRLDAEYERTHVGVAAGDYVVLVVSDTGMGMSDDVQARIFEPFFTTKEGGKGTGLGLSTVYGIVKQCGGDVRVESRPGRGATFKVYFPRTLDPVEGVEVVSPPKRAPEGHGTILLVEDDQSVRELARDILLQQGYTVLDCATGTEALEQCGQRREGVDLLLTDVVMPGLTGPELARQLQQRYPRVKTLFMSGYTEDRAFHEGVGGDSLLQKPFTPDELVRKVGELLQSGHNPSIMLPNRKENARSEAAR